MQQLVRALQFCHQGIVPRHLAPEDLLSDEGIKVKLEDFGLSPEFLSPKPSTDCGCPLVLPGAPLGPELRQPHSR